MNANRTGRPRRRRSLPRALLTRAALVAAAFAALHLAGARRYTSFLSGTLHAPAGDAEVTVILGILYALAHIAVTTLAPVLAIAAVLLRLDDRRRNPRAGPTPGGTP